VRTPSSSKYPQIMSSELTQRRTNGMASSNDSEKKSPVVVFLLGWTGSKDRFIQKYAELYEQLFKESGRKFEIEIFSEHCDLWVSRLGTPGAWRKAAESLVGKMRKRLSSGLSDGTRSPKSPSNTSGEKELIVHLFSNGGGLLWSEIGRSGVLKQPVRSQLLLTSGEKDGSPDPNSGATIADHLAGVIYDSSPGNVGSILAAYRFFWESQRSPVVRFFLVTLLFPLLTLGFGSWYTLTLQFLRKDNWTASYLKGMVAANGNHTPALLMYSEADKLIDYRYVQKFGELLGGSGVAVSTKKFMGTEHVLHLRGDPVTYEKSAREFLVGILE
jgi:hypothetical protein